MKIFIFQRYSRFTENKFSAVKSDILHNGDNKAAEIQSLCLFYLVCFGDFQQLLAQGFGSDVVPDGVDVGVEDKLLDKFFGQVAVDTHIAPMAFVEVPCRGDFRMLFP